MKQPEPSRAVAAVQHRAWPGVLTGSLAFSEDGRTSESRITYRMNYGGELNDHDSGGNYPEPSVWRKDRPVMFVMVLLGR